MSLRNLEIFEMTLKINCPELQDEKKYQWNGMLCEPNISSVFQVLMTNFAYESFQTSADCDSSFLRQ